MRGGRQIFAASVLGMYMNIKCAVNKADNRYKHCPGSGSNDESGLIFKRFFYTPSLHFKCAYEVAQGAVYGSWDSEALAFADDRTAD